MTAAPLLDLEPRRLSLVPATPPKPPPPAPETLQGIGSGIRELLIKVGGLATDNDILTKAVGRVEYAQNEQGFQIRALQRGHEELRETVAEHKDRLVELERGPSHARDVTDDDAETTDHGTKRVAPSVWNAIHEDKRRTARALSDLREQVEALSKERNDARLRAEGAEQEKDRVRAQVETDKRLALETSKMEKARLERNLTITKIIVAILAVAATAMRLLHL
jgi:hypothetical protein